MARLTPEQKQKRRAAEAAYKRAVAQSFADWNTQERAMLTAIRDDLTNYENAIKASLANVTEWDAHRIDEINAMFDDAKARLNNRLNGDYAAATDATVKLAVDSVTKPLEAFGVHIGAAGRQLPIQQLNYLRSVTPTLITNATNDAHEQVRQLLYTHAHGGMSRGDLLKKIGSAVGPLDGKAELKPGQIIPRAEARARSIFRTETNRVASLVTDNEIKKLSAVDKGVGARWVHWPSQNPRREHEALNGTVIFPGHGEFFEVGGVKVTGPHDPSLPASEVVSCHCKALVTYDPDKADDARDPALADAPSASGAPAATPAAVPAPKPAVKTPAPRKAKPSKAAPDAGPVTVKAADKTTGGSAIPKAPVAEPVAKPKAKRISATLKPGDPIADYGDKMPRQLVDDVYRPLAKENGYAELSAAEHKIVSRYQASGSVNWRIRNGELLESDQSLIEGLDAVIGKGSLSKNLRVYRGVEWSDDLDAKMGAGDPRKLVGTIWKDDAYTSTTLSRRATNQFLAGKQDDPDALRGYIWKIDAPRGSKMTFVDEGTGMMTKQEVEVLFGRKQKLLVTGAEKLDNGVWEISAEVVV